MIPTQRSRRDRFAYRLLYLLAHLLAQEYFWRASAGIVGETARSGTIADSRLHTISQAAYMTLANHRVLAGSCVIPV